MLIHCYGWIFSQTLIKCDLRRQINGQPGQSFLLCRVLETNGVAYLRRIPVLC